jgi:hypothetical protein
MRNKRILGFILAAAGMIDVVISAVVLDSIPRTVVLLSGLTTLALGIFLIVSGLRSGKT